eukprot:4187545-Karenia_brevis.AAC.1
MKWVLMAVLRVVGGSSTINQWHIPDTPATPMGMSAKMTGLAWPPTPPASNSVRTGRKRSLKPCLFARQAHQR